MIRLALLTALIATSAHADSLADVVRERVLSALPEGTDVAAVHLPKVLAALEIDPAAVTVELPRWLVVGRPSVKVSIHGKRAQYVPITIARVAEVAVARRAVPAGSELLAADFAVELRAVEGEPAAPAAALVGARVTHAIAAGELVRTRDVTLAPPLPRGTQITVELHRGGVRVRGIGTLELAARPGEAATVRLAHTRAIVRGTLVAPATVLVGGTP